MQSPEGSVGKRNGDVQFEHWQAEELLVQLDPLVARLNEVLTGFKYDRKTLAQLLAGLQQFMEEAMGVNALHKTTPKLPARLFHDFSPDGPLLTVASLCAELMKSSSKAAKRIDWTSPQTRKENTDLVLRIRSELLRAGHMRTPKVHVLPACGRDEMRLRHAVQRLGGEVVPSADAPGVTHVVHPFGPAGDPDDGQPYLTTLQVRGAKARVHWWYLPDSYNEWIDASAAPEGVDPDHAPPPGHPWHVYPRWVTDSDKFNEWMNEADYETEEGAAGAKRARGDGSTEAAAAAGSAAPPGAKRSRGDSRRGGVAGEVVSPGVAQSLGPGAIRRHLVHPLRKAVDGAGSVIDISHGQRQQAQGVPLAAAPAALPPPPADQLAPAPLRAAWFGPGGVGEPERAAFPEYFTGRPGARSPELYVAIRGHILARFAEAPRRELTFTEALRGLDADANDVRRVFDALERWGVINCAGGSGALASGLEGGRQAIGADAVLRLHPPPTTVEAVEAAATGGGGRVRAGTFRRAAPQPAALASGARYFCNAMPWVDCTAMRWHCTKLPDVDLCPQAYAEGRFPPGCSGKDFVRVAAADPVPDAGGWSPQETALLLEALELYGEDWAAIAEHVGGKSQLQCVMHMLQLPIEESLLPQPGGGGGGEGGAAPIPFADAGNPVMAQLSVLSSVVGPRVAAAAARGALEAITQEDAAARDAMAAAAGGGAGDAAVLDAVQHRTAAAAGLASAAVKARLMADAEEREMQRLAVVACELQLQRVNAKLAYLEAVDGVVKAQAEGLVGIRQGFAAQLAEMKQGGGGAAEGAEQAQQGRAPQ